MSKNPNRRRIFVGTVLDKGEKVRVKAPHPMTRPQFKEWKNNLTRKDLDEIKEGQRLRTLPEWLQWRSIYPFQSEKVIDRKAKESLGAKSTSRSKFRQISKCQAEPEGVGIAPSRKKHLPAFPQRVAIFPDTARGKRAAEKYADELMAVDYEGEQGERALVVPDSERRSVRVVRTYCRDFEPEGWYNAVWVGQASRTVARGRVDEGATYDYRSGLRGTSKRHNTGMTAKIRSVECPKCGAPSGENCAKSPRTYAEAMELIDAGEFTKRQILGNPHAARQRKYKEENE